MMDSPFYRRNSWNLPSRPRPYVREIPVHYVGSQQRRPSRSDSAAKIQKVFRGFLVRKSVKKIAEIRNEVQEIEKRISKKETIDLIVRDSKERLKVNEMLMNLLFRLDSVRGVDSGVRDCRKTVIKKAIALQETLDAAVSCNDKNDQISLYEAAENDNAGKVMEAVDQNQMVEMECTEDGEDRDDPVKEETEVLGDNEIVENHDGVKENENVENQNDGRKDREAVEDYDVMQTVSDCPEESVGTSQADSSANPESLTEACEIVDNSSPKQDDINAIESQKEVDVKESGRRGTGDESTSNRDLLERMMEDNEKMMDMMAQLFERNEMQTKLLSSLSHRVERLEKAFICERLRRKKKQHR